MGCEHHARLVERDLLCGVAGLGGEIGNECLRFLLAGDVHHADLLCREMALGQVDDPALGSLSSALTIQQRQLNRVDLMPAASSRTPPPRLPR